MFPVLISLTEDLFRLYFNSSQVYTVGSIFSIGSHETQIGMHCLFGISSFFQLQLTVSICPGGDVHLRSPVSVSCIVYSDKYFILSGSFSFSAVVRPVEFQRS